MQAVTRD